jgi:hypothetical protein
MSQWQNNQQELAEYKESVKVQVEQQLLFHSYSKLKSFVFSVNLSICPCQLLNSFGAMEHCGQRPALNSSKHDEL